MLHATLSGIARIWLVANGPKPHHQRIRVVRRTCRSFSLSIRSGSAPAPVFIRHFKPSETEVMQRKSFFSRKYLVAATLAATSFALALPAVADTFSVPYFKAVT